jgi:hypothetical protein
LANSFCAAVVVACAAPRCGSHIDKPVLRSEHQSMDGWIVLEEKTVEAIGIRLLAGSTLRALTGAGASERTLKVYECTGFGELCRRFEARGATAY